jgi:prevent-host-death family protein
MRVGVRELKNHTTEILRQVREEQAQFVVTYYGRPVAVLLPVDEHWLAQEVERAAEATNPGEDLAAEVEAMSRQAERGPRRGRKTDEFVWE